MKPYKYKTVVLLLISLIFFSFSFTSAAADKISMNFKGADIRDVLRTIAELADVNLVTDGSVNGEITIHLKEISFLDALKLITQTHNLAYKWSGNTVVVATPEKIEQIYSAMTIKTVVVKHAKLAEIQSIINQIYPNLSVTIDQRNKSLIFRGKVEDIKAVEDLLKNLDTEKNPTIEIISIPVEKSEFLSEYLQRVNPDLVIESDKNGKLIIYGSSNDISNASLLLEKLVKELDEEKIIIKEEYSIIETIKIKYVEVAYIKELITQMYPEIRILADSQNSQLIYNDSEEDLRTIKNLVSKIDLPITDFKEGYNKETIIVNYAEIDDVKKAIEDLSPYLNVKLLTGTKQLIVTGPEDDIKSAVTLAASIDENNKTVTRIATIDYASLEDIEGIITDIYPEIGFKSSGRKKEIIINGMNDMVEDVFALIDKVDVPRKQVIIEARVEEISTTDMSELGINSEQMSQIEIIDVNDDGKIDGVGLDFADFIKALETKGNSNTLANPRLMTLSGEEARLLIGDRIPITVESIQEGSVITSVEYIEAGINLVFTPWITSDNKINLKVNPQVSTIGESIGTALPPINTREAETTIRLNDGETFAIGGLIQDDVIESISKVPLLAEIPILGHLFKSRKVQNMKTELIIFITPHIVNEKLVDQDNTDRIEQNKSQSEDYNSLDGEILENKQEIKKGVVDNTKKKSSSFIALTKDELNKIIRSNNQVSEEKSTFNIANNDDKNNQDKDREDNDNEDNKDNDNEDEQILKDINSEKKKTIKSSQETIKLVDNKYEKNKEEELVNKDLENEEENEKINEDLNKFKNVEEENIIIQENAENNNADVIIKERNQAKPIDLDEYYLYKYYLTEIITVRELANLYNIKEELIIEANKDNNASVGSTINLPLPKSRIYTMKKGDTLYKIHNLYGVSIEDIKKLNRIENEHIISMGTEIVLP